MIRDIDVVILCGGQGTRLQSIVKDRPKPMAEINGRPFLDILIYYVSTFGLNRFILLTGHQADYLEKYYCQQNGSRSIQFSFEKTPLGTGGALKNAEPLISSESFLIMNGDSYCPVDLRDFYDFHQNKNAELSLVACATDDPSDFGSIGLDNQGRITSFREKVNDGKKYINAGIYLFKKNVLSMIPDQTFCSLEKNLFPQMIGKEFYGYISKEKVIDIGTPERYALARRLLKGDKTIATLSD